MWKNCWRGLIWMVTTLISFWTTKTVLWTISPHLTKIEARELAASNQKLSTFRQISNIYAALWEVKTMLATYMIVFIAVSYETITVKFIALRLKLPFVFFLIEKEKTAFSRTQKSSKQKKGSATTKSEIDCPTKSLKRHSLAKNKTHLRMNGSWYLQNYLKTAKSSQDYFQGSCKCMFTSRWGRSLFCNVTFVVSAYLFEWNVGSCFTPFQKLLVIKHFSFTVVIYHLIENQTKFGYIYSQAIDFLDGPFLFQQVFPGCSHRLLQSETPGVKLQLVNFHLLCKTMMKNISI